MFKFLSLGCLGLLLVVGFILVVGAVAGSRSQPTPTVVAAPAASPTPVQAAAPKAEPTGASAAAAPAPTPAPKPQPTPTSAAPVAKVGERVVSGGIALTVNSVTRTDSLGQFQKAKPGRVFVVADVTVESVTREKAVYNPLYFKAKDADGYEYTASLLAGDQGLKSGELNPGEKARGTVAFDVPSEAKGLIMSYQPIVILGGYQTIRIALD
jgi:Domain of unknown function (DUF4352)